MNVVVQQTAIPVSEAQQIAALAVKGTWNIKELGAEQTNWRSFVLRETIPSLDVSSSFPKPKIAGATRCPLGRPRRITLRIMQASLLPPSVS